MAISCLQVFEEKFKKCPPDDGHLPPTPMATPIAPGRLVPKSEATLNSPPMRSSHAVTSTPLPPGQHNNIDAGHDIENKDDWNRRLLLVQEQMKQLSDQIRLLVEEAAARKRQRRKFAGLP